jgi:hypothetical protein
LECCSWHPDCSNHPCSGWGYSARLSFHASSRIESKIQHLFPPLPFPSSQYLFTGHGLWSLNICWLAWVRKHLWRCENGTRRPPWS